MRKLLFLLLVLCLVACDKSSDETDTPVALKNCVLTEETFTISFSSRKTKTVNSYDATTGQIVKSVVTVSVDNGEWMPHGHWEYTYNTMGLIEQENYVYKDGVVSARITYAYDASKLLTKATIYRLESGELKENSVYNYQYDSSTQLKRVDAQLPMFNTPVYHTFEYKDGIMIKNTSFKQDGTIRYVLEYTYDDKKRVLTPDFGFNSRYIEFAGFPYQHNITSKTMTSPNDPNNADALNSYTATFEYNEAGYPTTETRLYGDGEQATKTFTYTCK